MALFSDFKKFALKGNLIDLAIGVILGLAFGKIITSLVDDIIMPLINPLIPGGNWQAATIGPGIKIGSFAAATLNFLIIAFTVFLIFRVVQKVREKDQEAPAEPPAPSNTDKLLMEIRDALKAGRI